MPQDQSTADITEILISCKYYLLKVVILTQKKKNKTWIWNRIKEG